MEKQNLYDGLLPQLAALLRGETDPVANMSNMAAALYHALPQVNWAGFYILRNGVLVLGPFQGRPACVRILPGQGACGACVERAQPVRVADVNHFPGHIACDSASKSEIVLPILKNGHVWGVLDIDSPILNRFDLLDQTALQSSVKLLEKYSLL